MQYNKIFTNCAVVSDENFDLLTAEQLEAFTQAERAFVLVFLADTLANLTQVNADCAVENDNYFVRLADAQEVMQNLQMLYDTLDDSDDCTNIQFTLADAGAALCSYDTEYRECIAEQFEDACDNAAKLAKQTGNTNADYSTLAVRVLCSY